MVALYLLPRDQPAAAPAAADRVAPGRARSSATPSTWATGGPRPRRRSTAGRIFLWIVPAVAGGSWALTDGGRHRLCAGARAALPGRDRHADRRRRRGRAARRRAARHGVRLHRGRAGLARHDRRRGDRRRGRLERAAARPESGTLRPEMVAGLAPASPGSGRSARRRAGPRGSQTQVRDAGRSIADRARRLHRWTSICEPEATMVPAIAGGEPAGPPESDHRRGRARRLPVARRWRSPATGVAQRRDRA